MSANVDFHANLGSSDPIAVCTNKFLLDYALSHRDNIFHYATL